MLKVVLLVPYKHNHFLFAMSHLRQHGLTLLCYSSLIFSVSKHILIACWIALTSPPPTIKPVEFAWNHRLSQFCVHFVVLLAHPPERSRTQHSNHLPATHVTNSRLLSTRGGFFSTALLRQTTINQMYKTSLHHRKSGAQCGQAYSAPTARISSRADCFWLSVG